MIRAGVLLLGLLSASGVAGEVGEWRLQGETHLHMEQYRVSGDERLSPYAHEGTQSFQELNLQLSGRPTVNQYWELNTSGVLSQSDYRTDDQGFTAEWLHLRHENTAGALPLRLDMGDQYARFSRYTLDRTLQGARVEVQAAESTDWRNSVVWMSGRDRSDWVGSTGTGDRFHGGSWLVQHDRYGRYSVNLVQAESDDDRETPADDHLVSSLAAEWKLPLFRQTMAAEAEWAWLDGSANAAETGGDRAVGLRLDGKDRYLPLGYDFRYERFGEGFEPAGVHREPSARLADSRRLGAGGNWRFPAGVEFHGRYDRYVDDASSQVLAVDDWLLRVKAPATFGLTPRLGSEWALRFRDRENRVGSVDTEATEASWRLRLADDGTDTVTRLNLRWYELDDHAAGVLTRRERHLSLDHTRGLLLGGATLRVTPGVDYRNQTGHGEVTLLNPTLRVGATRDRHRMGLNLGFRELDRPTASDLHEYSLRVDYRYSLRTHVFGLEYDHMLRDVRQEDDMEAWRAGAFWRYSFDHGLTGRAMSAPHGS